MSSFGSPAPTFLCLPASYLLAVFIGGNEAINQVNGTSENVLTVFFPTEPPHIALDPQLWGSLPGS